MEDPEALEATLRLTLAWLRSVFAINQNTWMESWNALRDSAGTITTITEKKY